MNNPADLRYTEHDEWVRLDGTTLTLGITDFAQSQLGELVFVEVPELGAAFEAGDAVCEVESVKAVAEVYVPVSGRVIGVNDALADDAEIVNRDPYGEGWLIRLEVDADVDLSSLMDAAAYAAKVEA